jgi:FtsZ-interacting cell division protein ZipA
VSPVKYELGFCIPEDNIFHRHRRENLKSYITFTGWALRRRRNVSPVKYELGFCIPEDDIFHSHRRENLKSYMDV